MNKMTHKNPPDLHKWFIDHSQMCHSIKDLTRVSHGALCMAPMHEAIIHPYGDIAMWVPAPRVYHMERYVWHPGSTMYTINEVNLPVTEGKG